MMFKPWVKREFAVALGVSPDEMESRYDRGRVSLVCRGREVLWCDESEVDAVSEAIWLLRCARRNGLDAFEEC